MARTWTRRRRGLGACRRRSWGPEYNARGRPGVHSSSGRLGRLAGAQAVHRGVVVYVEDAHGPIGTGRKVGMATGLRRDVLAGAVGEDAAAVLTAGSEVRIT